MKAMAAKTIGRSIGNVRLYGDTAVVTFKLIGTPVDGTAMFGYFNTGVFLRQSGRWRVVAMQATKNPPT